MDMYLVRFPTPLGPVPMSGTDIFVCPRYMGLKAKSVV